MPTNRTRINRPMHAQITPRAIEAFANMQRLLKRCTCPSYVYGQHNPRCHACEQRDDEHWVLCTELQVKPWEYPCVRRPDGRDVDEDGKLKSSWRRLAEQRWTVLDEAVREQRRQQRAAKTSRRSSGSSSAPESPPPIAAAPHTEE